MDTKTNKIISDYIATVAEENANLIKAYLFGSYASKNDKKDSDIDLALIINHLNDEERFDLQVKLMLLATDFDLRIEPHPIAKKDFNFNNPFVAEILKTGIEIEPKSPQEWFI